MLLIQALKEVRIPKQLSTFFVGYHFQPHIIQAGCYFPPWEVSIFMFNLENCHNIICYIILSLNSCVNPGKLHLYFSAHQDQEQSCLELDTICSPSSWSASLPHPETLPPFAQFASIFPNLHQFSPICINFRQYASIYLAQHQHPSPIRKLFPLCPTFSLASRKHHCQKLCPACYL